MHSGESQPLQRSSNNRIPMFVDRAEFSVCFFSEERGMLMKFTRLGLVLSLFLLPLAASAQLAVYADFSAGQLNTPDTGWSYGPTFGAYYGKGFPLVNLGLDLRGSLLGTGSSNEVDSGQIGPRVAVHLPVVPLKPYVEGLVGMGHASIRQTYASADGNYLEYSVVAGADLTILPRIDWRVAEYTYSRLPNLLGGTDETSISTGIVLRIPFL